MADSRAWCFRTAWLLMAAVSIGVVTVPRMASGDVYHVNPSVATAADTNPGTEEAPWRTISRAAAAQELRPGDTVLIHSGVYREHVEVKDSGQPERPITFSAATGARVVVKGSELVRGHWERLAEQADVPEPYPNAFATMRIFGFSAM